ncbi:MAG: hypothetical protein P4L44_09050 [Oryzomonas sp.]|uniref:hypothetical protein n=1 Tax=Oryzomonas sp. TaxID=2855186 RepID=UPI0028482B1C|nr:hypothetical protein [Oryzomonas sp.]MDR3580095.1 hypothetical protein [Oryzomonas sp.]
MPKEIAEPILQPHIPLIRSCIIDAWHEGLDDPKWHKYNLRTKRNVVRDFIVFNIQEHFSGIKETKLINSNGYFFLKIERYLIRFKKLDINRLTSNFPTQQAHALEKQQLEIPGFKGHTILNAGYTADRFETKILAAAITKRNGKFNEWEILLGGTEHGFTELPVQQNFDEILPIRPRKDLLPEETKDESKDKS